MVLCACHRCISALEDELESRYSQSRSCFILKGSFLCRHPLGHAQTADHRQCAGTQRNPIVLGDLRAVHADRALVNLIGRTARIEDLAGRSHAQRNLFRRNPHQIFRIDYGEAAFLEPLSVVSLGRAVRL